jgi:hypothetical protein
MTDLSRAAVPGAVRQTAAEPRHPSTFAPATFVFLIVLCLFGAVIGVQLILQLGITPNTSIIGALVAMLLALPTDREPAFVRTSLRAEARALTRPG